MNGSTEQEALARRLMQTRVAKSNLPTAIFGSTDATTKALDLDRPRFRIGIWPIICGHQPEAAMGIGTVLAFLLESYTQVRVYRIFARLDGDPAVYRWRIDDSQFDIDDWQLDALDENVAIWGKMEEAADGWTLTLNIENDLAAATEDLRTFQWTKPDLGELTAHLINAAAEIAEFLELDLDTSGFLTPFYITDRSQRWDDTQIRHLLESVFRCELALFLHLWGAHWPLTDMEQALRQLVEVSEEVTDIGVWATASVLVRLLTMIGEDAENLLMSYTDRIASTFPESTASSVILARGLYTNGFVQEAYDLLDETIERHAENAVPRLALAELLRRGARIFDALDVFQEAIEEGISDTRLYVRYADLLSLIEYNGLIVEDFVLVNTEAQRGRNLIALETLAAYTAALELEPDDVEALSGQVMQLIEMGTAGDRLWESFSRLVERDLSGEHVRTAIDSLDNIADPEPAIQIVRRAAEQHTDRSDLYVCLGMLYMLTDNEKSALRALTTAKALTTDKTDLMDIERLMLAAQNPDFEMQFGEIIDLLSAGAAIDTEKAEFLETVIESAPTLTEAYTLLAKVYLSWSESGSAVDILLDGHKRAPNDPDIVFALGQTLWDAGERELALSYLNKGVAHNPNHVPLLSLTGRCLFDNEQDEEAKAHLTRAELIAPRDPFLNQVRAYIAGKLRE